MYIDVMNMNLLSVVTPLSIYIGWSTQKTLWEIQFAPVNMKICCRRNVSKHRNIKDCYKYITLEISLEFGILDMMRIIIWGYQQRDLLPIWVSIPLEGQRKRKKAGYSITDVSLKEISSNIREFEKLPYEGYVRKKPKHEPTESYFYTAIHIYKCMMRSGTFNLHVDPVRMENNSTQ